MSESINWLHLSDLHFGGGGPYLWPKLKNELFTDLRKVGERSGPFDIVFFTGDFVQSGLMGEFDSLTADVVEMWDVLEKIGKRPVLCAVPGNHDLCRPLQSSLVPMLLKHWWSDQDIREQFWKTPEFESRREMASMFKNYTDWIGGLPVPVPQMNMGLLPGDFSATIEIGERRIGVVGLNTAFLQIVPGDFECKLDIHVSQLLALCANDTDRWIRDHDISVLLTHHPTSWLHPDAQQHFRDEIYPSGRFHAHFCGHQHIPSQYDISEGGSVPRRLRQGPSIFGLETYGLQGDALRRHGYNAGQFEFDGNHGIERMWPRDAVRALSGGIRLRPDQRYDLTEEDCVVSPFDIDREGSEGEEDPESLCLQSDEPVPTTPSDRHVEPELALLDPVPDEATAAMGLAACVRFTVAAVPPHCAVRLDEQTQFENALRQQRVVWIKADWATGVEGFISASLERFRKQAPAPVVFQLDCEGGEDADQFESLFLQQFGMSMQRFCVLIAPLPSPFLLLTAVPFALATGDSSEQFSTIIAAILDYCPNLKIVIASRDEPQSVSMPRVDLRPLEPADVRTYLLNHPDAAAGIKEPDVIEKIHERSDGLPVHIDRMLCALKVASLESVLDAELEGIRSGELATENVPKALVQAVDSLASSKDRSTQRSLRLLKVLSVLPYGETIECMRHFLPTEPFFIANASQLNNLGLLDVIPLSVSVPRIVVGRSVVSEPLASKVLKVPRQVRDYVQSLLSEDEWSGFINAGADQFFGRRWRDNKIRPRVVPLDYREFLDNRPGNEFAVIHHLLQDAKTKADTQSARRAARLAVHYCRALRHKVRYRDLAIVAGGILQVADPSVITEQWAEIAYMYGLALRMTGKTTNAVEHLRQALTTPCVHLSDNVKASIFLNIALGEESMNHQSEAIEAAEEVKRLSKERDSKHFQAHCIIKGLRETGTLRMQRLQDLAQEARTRGFASIADNLALDIASATKDPREKARLLDTVLANRSVDAYNKTRAIAAKTEATSEAADGTTLALSDRIALSEAYSYAHSQRFGSLFNTCHDGMWQSLQETCDVQQLLRLFRHSSFIWRIRGEDAREAEYAEKLSALKPPDESATPARMFLIEVRYFWKRLKVISGNP